MSTLESRHTRGFITPVRRKQGGINTGIAIQNTEEQAVTLNFTLRSADGQEVSKRTANQELSIGDHLALFIDQLFKDTATNDFEGTLVVQATGGKVAANLLQQQERFNAFQTEYNRERPHEALAMKYPAEVCTPSTRPYRGIGCREYPLHDRTVTVTSCGRICMKGKKINFSRALAGQNVGIRRSTIKSGSYPLCNTIGATLTKIANGSNPRRTLWVQECYPCLRNKL